MAGEGSADTIAAYLSRLTGRPVLVDDAVALRSIHRAAFASWARAQGLDIRTPAIGSSEPFSIRQLLAGAADEPTAPALAATLEQGPARLGGGALIGIDIEEADSLPAATDYREHPFYREHFSAAEIAYCIRQADPRSAFCGAWAAKEAILKSGLLAAAPERLAAIEITHDPDGRPRHPSCDLSISHTPRLAIAICIAGATAPAAEPAAPAPAPAPALASAPRPRSKALNLVAVACVSALAGGGAVFLALHGLAGR